MLLAVPCIRKFFVSDQRISCLLPASVKQEQACKEGEIKYQTQQNETETQVEKWNQSPVQTAHSLLFIRNLRIKTRIKIHFLKEKK